MKKQPWQKHLMRIWCGALIAFSISACCSLAGTIPESQQPPMPMAPVQEKVVFEPLQDGLFLSFDDYRRLEGNIIELRRYIDELTAQIEFYTGEIDEQRR